MPLVTRTSGDHLNDFARVAGDQNEVSDYKHCDESEAAKMNYSGAVVAAE
jgi:hypothetical protein